MQIYLKNPNILNMGYIFRGKRRFLPYSYNLSLATFPASLFLPETKLAPRKIVYIGKATKINL